jgi:hypothetical protein
LDGSIYCIWDRDQKMDRFLSKVNPVSLINEHKLTMMIRPAILSASVLMD